MSVMCYIILYCVITKGLWQAPLTIIVIDCCIIVMRLSLWCMYYYKIIKILSSIEHCHNHSHME